MHRPESIDEFNRAQEAHERRQEAYDRHKRQQFELFDASDLLTIDATLEAKYEYPECPNCGEHARPVLGISEDRSVGYCAEEQGCTACMEASHE
jgi:hypothetical protein